MATSVDEHCRQVPGAQIHGGYTCTLNQVNIGNNANKFYLMQVLACNGSTYLWKRWGRVGAVGQYKLDGPSSEAHMVASFKHTFGDKTGLDWEHRTDPPKKGKYAYMRLDVANTSTGAHTSGTVTVSGMVRAPMPTTDPTLEPRVCAVIRDLYDERMMTNAMAVTYQIDVQKLPLGKLSIAQIDDAEKILKQIEDAISAARRGVSHADLEDLSSSFWTLIPQASAMNQRLPVISTDQQVHQLADVLDGLRNIQVASAGLQRSLTLGDMYRSMGITLTPCVAEEMQLLSALLTGTISPAHGCNIELVEAFSIDKISQDVRDVRGYFASLSDHRMLFHGSRTSNFVGILTEGLRVPRQDQVSNGSTLGLGCYFADCSTKSLQYCHIKKGETGYMLLCEVALGTKHVTHGCCPDRIAPPFQSRFARGRRTPNYVKEEKTGVWYPIGPVLFKSDTTFTTFEHNEAVAFDVNQYRFRYLMKIKSV